jgi:hypothetical protein
MMSVELPATLKAGLEAVKQRDGIPLSEQIRRAIRAWLEMKGIEIETKGAPKKKTSRKK